MRQRTVLTALCLLATVLATHGIADTLPTRGLISPEQPIRVIRPHVAEEPTDGLIPLAGSGDGATLVLSGVLTREAFALDSIGVFASRLAGRSSDPDQFRAVLLSKDGMELGVVKMWSPLTQFQWDPAGAHEALHRFDTRRVEIPLPVSIDLQTVALTWPKGAAVARVEVGQAIRQFCSIAPDNPACRLSLR